MSDDDSGFRGTFASVLKVFMDPTAPKKKLSDFSLRECQIFLGDLQRRCLAYQQTALGPTAAPAEESYLRLTKEDVRYLWAIEQFLIQYEVQRVGEADREGRRTGRKG